MTILALLVSFLFSPGQSLAQPAMSYQPAIKVVSVTPDRKILHDLTVLGCKIEVIKIEAEDPVTQQTGNLQIRVYTPRAKSSSRRSILVVPPTGGENLLDRGYADLFCRHHFRVAIVEHWTGDDDSATDLDLHDRGMIRGVAAVRHTIEYLAPAANEPLGILGTSLGAIITAVTVGYEPRISAMALIVGGGGLAEINATSNEPAIIQLRQERMKTYGFKTAAEYENALNQHIQYDPLVSAKYSAVKHHYMMIAEKDLTVPTVNQVKLLKAIGANQVEQHYFKSNHLKTIVYAFLTQKLHFVRFFKESLTLRSPQN